MNLMYYGMAIQALGTSLLMATDVIKVSAGHQLVCGILLLILGSFCENENGKR